MIRSMTIRGLFAAGLCSSAAAATAAGQYNVTPVDVTDPDMLPHEFKAMNLHGQVVGASAFTAFATHAEGQDAVDVSHGHVDTWATGINNSGQVSGYNIRYGTRSHGFRVDSDGSRFRHIPHMGHGDWLSPSAINNNGYIVGSGNLRTGGWLRAFITTGPDDLTPIDLGTLPSSYESQAWGVNDAGDVVGHCLFGLNTHAFVFVHGERKMQDLGTLGGNARALAINVHQLITGYSYTPAGDQHVILSRPGQKQLTDLGALPGSRNAEGLAINRQGDVVGVDSGGEIRAILIPASDRKIVDLNSLVPLPHVVFTKALAINDRGEILVVDTDQHAYILHPVAADPAP